jgi:hypothetical protein
LRRSRAGKRHKRRGRENAKDHPRRLKRIVIVRNG